MAVSGLALMVGAMVMLALMFLPTPGLAAASSCDPGVDMCLTVTTGGGTPTLSLPLAGTVAVSVDWGDGSADTFTSAGDTPGHAFAPYSTYHIVIAPDTTTSPLGPWLTHFGDTAGYAGAPVITSVESFGTLGVISLSGAFDGASNLVAVPASLPSGVTDLSSAFDAASSFNQSLDGWNTAAVTNMAEMFSGASGFKSDIGAWDTSHVTDMSNMFKFAVAFDQPIGGWNTSSVTTMDGMFSSAAAFDQPVGGWDTSQVTDMGYLFFAANAFNQPLTGWHTGAVTTMSNMFSGDYAFNQPLELAGWDTSHVTNVSAMFDDATSFDQPLASWNTQSVTDMSDMFHGAAAFNQPLAGWDTSKVVNMAFMFAEAVVFDQPIGDWPTRAVADMDNMFDGAISFDQAIGAWDVAHVTSMANMFDGAAGLSLANYDGLLAGWAAEAVRPGVIFDAGTTTAYNGLAAAAHAQLTSATGDDWSITDGGPTNAQIPSTITSAPVASAITYGQRLGASQLTGGTASTLGTFAFVSPTQVPVSGTSRVSVRFTPASPYYAPVAILVPIRVAKARATLTLSGLTATRHGRSVTVTVSRLVAGARLTLVWQTGHHVARRALTVVGTTVRVVLALRLRGAYRVTASATDANVTFGSVSGFVRAG